MTYNHTLNNLTDKCDIYFEESLISKEMIIKRYADFFTSSLSGDEHSVSVALHTGSVCFDAVLFIVAALAGITLDETDAESIIASLNEGDMVIYKNERYRWCGMEVMDGKQYMVLLQDERGRASKTTTKAQFDKNKNHLKPYFGASEVTDGRGIRHGNADRNDFISRVLGIPASDIPGVTGASTVVVAEREVFDRLVRGLRIVYGDGKSLRLLDIVTASYFSNTGEEYQYGNNPAKTEPALKVTGKISTARDLVLDKHGNKTIGLIVIGADAVSKGGSELEDLLGRRSLKFAHVSVSIDAEFAQSIIESQEETAVFACTKEFLLQNSLPPQKTNTLTVELDRQVNNIVNNAVETILIEDAFSWDDFRKVREALYIIKKSDWNEGDKNSFLIAAYSLLNLIVTAVFPIEILEKAIREGAVIAGVSSLDQKIREMKSLMINAGSMKARCDYVIMVLEYLYLSFLTECPKGNALKKHIESLNGRKAVIVVPKAYYIDILSADEVFSTKNISIVTANRFDSSGVYDEIIAIGDISGKRFDPLKCRAAEEITVMLYECETHLFKHRKRMAEKLENKLNFRMGVRDDDSYSDSSQRGEVTEEDLLDAFIEESEDLEQFIGRISSFDIGKFAERVAGNTGASQAAEVSAMGKFTSGEQIFFSKYYTAVVFNSAKSSVTEADVEDLTSGDLLIFAKRDDYTRNTVDYIYESLLTSGRLSDDVVDATEKSFYWKEVLKEYKRKNGLSYRDVAMLLHVLGSSIQEVSVRQWLIEESHIVGPRDESTLRQIAQLTNDHYLLADTHSYFEACRIVRRQRKEILELIGKAIADKFSGNRPGKGSVLEVVYDNVENLSVTLELESISMLDEPVNVPINMINKPITDWEALI